MTKPQPSFIRRVLNFLVKAVLVFMILTCILGIYAGLKIRWAKKQVEAFNQLVVIGRPVAGLEKKAKEMSLKFGRRADSSDNNGRLYVWEGFAFGRWFCDVEYRDGKAIQKKVVFLD